MTGKKKKLNILDRLFLWLSVLLSLGLLISYLSPVTDPRTFWPIAFFGLAYPFLLLGNCLLALYWLLRKSKYIVVPVVSVLLGISTLKDNIGFRSSGKADENIESANSVRLMTYNAHNFKPYGEKNDLATKQQMLQLISDEQPDVIGIQEFYSRKRGQYAIKDSMCKIMQSQVYYFEPFSFSNEDEAMGIAVFSKYPIVNKGNIILSDERNSGNQCLYVDIKKANHTFRFYSIHLQSIQFDPTDYDYLSKVSKDGGANLGSSKRIGGKLKRAFLKRSEQVIKIKNHAASCPYPYVIAGDFNDTPASYAVHQMAKGLKNAFREKGSGFARTYNGSFPNFQIDYIMASPNMNVASYHIVKKRLSDHYPVCSTLLFK
ncbi:endonuclease/exonuclease/phosphatase family protein [Mucilaginibacter sp. PAMB04168]|uniref:endonuclease/exonuclease/phosphatase family protein n=1 Tax=Mucilaginibacter sp. PAMB04168 TaxID=3138567 RepID=UPI0031F61A68